MIAVSWPSATHVQAAFSQDIEVARRYYLRVEQQLELRVCCIAHDGSLRYGRLMDLFGEQRENSNCGLG
jgi:hypothetical protein